VIAGSFIGNESAHTDGHENFIRPPSRLHPVQDPRQGATGAQAVDNPVKVRVCWHPDNSRLASSRGVL